MESFVEALGNPDLFVHLQGLIVIINWQPTGNPPALETRMELKNALQSSMDGVVALRLSQGEGLPLLTAKLVEG